ncbi:MAG: hypothetical protein EA383_04940 [Spirochaetaceae bacterium]|nr:MAG: hypothetical protein EA383_04940 [Spirochaetaceae bacterium]
MVKRLSIVAWILIALVPVLLFVNAHQAFRFDRVQREIRQAESQQRTLLEANKRAITSVSALSSPARIDRLSREVFGLEQTFAGPRVEALSSALERRQ